jgi:hypothetical protein
LPDIDFIGIFTGDLEKKFKKKGVFFYSPLVRLISRFPAAAPSPSLPLHQCKKEEYALLH